MRLLEFLRGTARVIITGAYPQSCLNRMAAGQIPFWDVVQRDPLCLEATVYRSTLPRCGQAARRSMCQLEVQSLRGARAVFYGLKRRPVLLAGLVLAVAAALISQQYVWTLEVQGNEMVPAEQILRTLSELGVGVGTRRSGIDPQRLENRMLDRMPELGWFTINANSMRAVVLVKERIVKPELVNPHQPTNVVASQAGLIERMEVYDGQAVAEPGQMVLPGQLLVSGLTTSFRATLLHHAMAEVYARTWRTAEVLCAKTCREKTYTGRTGTTWRLVLGNKFMKICENGGISPDECDKIMTTYALTLPGGIRLPIALEKTVCRAYETAEQPRDEAQLQQQLAQDYLAALRREMEAGQVRALSHTLKDAGAYWRWSATCEATEQIGTLVPILIDTKDGEHG